MQPNRRQSRQTGRMTATDLLNVESNRNITSLSIHNFPASSNEVKEQAMRQTPLCGPFLHLTVEVSKEPDRPAGGSDALLTAQNTNPTCAEKARGVTKCVPLKVELKL
jgi:hypothetical protein